jgi:hypothetical protein
MLQTSPAPRKDLEPAEIALIACLRVFARRGLALRQAQGITLRQEQAQEQSKTVDSDNLGGAALSTAERQTPEGSTILNYKPAYSTQATISK